MADELLKSLEKQLAKAKERAESFAGIANKAGHDEQGKWRQQANDWRTLAMELEKAIALRHAEIGS
jgi:F0F1-type ATP synthase membrane subunit b/b'